MLPLVFGSAQTQKDKDKNKENTPNLRPAYFLELEIADFGNADDSDGGS